MTFGEDKKMGEMRVLQAEGTRQRSHRQSAWHIWEAGVAGQSEWPVGYEGYLV